METAMTTQQGLNEVVINKVQRMIENKAVGGKSHRIISPLSE